MASVNLTGTLTNPEGEPDEGAIVKFTLLTTTGNTVSSSKSQLEVPQDGLYDIDVVYGNLRVDYINEDGTTRFVAIVTVNGDTVATSLPELLNAAVPPTDAQLLQFQAILADAVTAQVAAEAAETGAVAAEATLLAEKLTTVQLIALSNTFAVGSVIDTLGYTSNGDGGGARWVKSGISGSTPSQSPAQLVDGLLNDASGNQWALVVDNRINVKSLGATGDGVTDDSNSFEAAAITAVSAQYLTQGNVIRPPTSEVQIPDGDYHLTRVIGSNNKFITWYLSEGTFIPTQDLWDSFDNDYKFGLRDQEQYLFGRVIRAGRIVSSPMGTRDQGVGFAVQMSAGNPARGAEIAGFSSYASPGGNSERPAVGIYADSVASVQEQIERTSGVTYTSTSALFSTPLTTSEIARLRIGMLVDTNHTGKKYTGIMTGWASDGNSITMDSWYELDNTAAGQTPPNTAGLKINPITKVWAGNFNTYIPANSHAHASTGIEIGLFDWKADSVQYLTEGRDIAVDASEHYVWGLHVTNLSTFNYKANSLIQLDGASWYAISTSNVCSNGFYYKGGGSALIAENDALTTRGRIINDGRYFFETNTTIDTGVPNKDGVTFWDPTIKTTAVGGLELGRQYGVSYPSIDFHTSGGNIDYDARVRVTGGDGVTTGDGFLWLEADGGAGRVYLDADDIIANNATRIRPADNNATKNGDTGNRWSETYSVAFRPGNIGDVVWTSGTGTPEGVVVAPIGSMFTRRDGGASTTLYVKESGVGNIGWIAK